MSEDLITNYLNENKDKGNMIFLNGSWGSGKTYRWDNLISNRIKKRNKIYVSLFGMKDIDELKREIFNQYINQKMLLFSKNVWLSIKNIFFMLFSVFFIFSILTAFIFYVFDKFNQLRDSYQIIYILTAIVCLLYVLWHWKTVLIYLLNKFVGINHNSIQIDRIYNTNDTVFCFDDFERLANTASPDQFLGYFNTLSKEYGYNILLISSTEEYAQNTKRHIIQYQEKIFDHIVYQENCNSLEKLHKLQNTNSELRDYLIKTFHNINKAYKQKDTYNKNDRKYVSMAHNNLRIILKIIKHMDMIYNKVSANELRKEKNHEDIIKFVVAMTYYFEVGYFNSIDQYLDYNYGKHLYNVSKNHSKEFVDIFYDSFFSSYRSIYDFIYEGKISNTFFEELLPSKYYTLTKFEKVMNNFHNTHCLNYRTNELKKICKKADEAIASENLFSSFKTMYSALGNYCILLSYLGKNFLKYKTKTTIYKEITNLINKQGIPQNYERTSFNWSSEDKNLNDAFKNIRSYVYAEHVKITHDKLLKKSVIDEFLVEGNSNDKTLINTICLLIIANSSTINLPDMANKEYQIFNSTIHKIFDFHCGEEFYKTICNILHYPALSYKNLIDKIIYIMTELKNNSPTYSTEVQNYKNYEATFESLYKRPIYTNFVATKSSKTKSKK